MHRMKSEHDALYKSMCEKKKERKRILAEKINRLALNRIARVNFMCHTLLI